MPLTDNFCKNVKQLEKTKKYSDSGGLYLQITASGRKYWRFKYRFNNKEKLLSIGVYPAISLKEAREKREEAKKLLIERIDPSQHKKEEKLAKNFSTGNSFQDIAIEWHNKKQSLWSSKYAKSMLLRLERNVFNEIGDLPIDQIKTRMILSVLKKIEDRGSAYLATRILQVCGQISRYAITLGRLEDWKIGRLEDWKIGRLEDWKIGRLEDWKIGRLEDWKIGRLEDDITSNLRSVIISHKPRKYNCLKES